MNEEPKSIWTKPLKQGPAWFLTWFLLVAGAAFVGLFAVGLLQESQSIGEWSWFALVASVGTALAIVGGAWFIRWLCCWRNLRRFLFAVACVLTLIALFYAEENWRGKHAWEKYKRAGEAKGEKFDLTSVAPPPVPDDQNFAMQPIWVEEISGMMGMERARTWYGDRVAALGHTNRVRPLTMPIELSGKSLQFTNRESNWQLGEKTDLKARQDYYRAIAGVTNSFPVPPTPQTPAEDVLLALSKYDSAIESLRTASKLPYARFPLTYADDAPAMILIPHLAPLKYCAVTLRLRAVAELRSGQTEKSLADIKLMLRLAEPLRTEPFLISHFVHIAMFNLALQPVWEGLAEHKWSDAQLITLEAELGKLDFLADYGLAVRGERASEIGTIDYLRRNRKQIARYIDMGAWGYDDDGNGSSAEKTGLPVQLFRLFPSGWFDQNKLSVCQMHDNYFLPIINLETKVFSASNQVRAKHAFEALFSKRSPFELFMHVFASPMQLTVKKFVHAQTSADMARIAIALERYRLARGGFPETLDTLAPQFMKQIPHDILNGKSLKYHRTDDGQFILYSIGWNEKDDGGQLAFSKNGKNVDWDEGDWVWRYPAK